MNADKHFLKVGSTIKEALAKLNDLGNYLTLFVLNDSGVLVGTITDGDIRRSMLRGGGLDEAVERVMNRHFIFLHAENITIEEIQKIKERQLTLIPVLDHAGRILRLVNFAKVKTVLPIDAVIMAGGEGKRLRPMTNLTPKPMLKIGKKPIIEYNIDRLREYGVQNCFITIKYLGEQIQSYFGSGESKEMKVEYVQETAEPLGTIGSVSLINSFAHDHILVMNSDLLTNIDLEDYFLEFLKSKADMAVATIPYQVKVPYAVLETEANFLVGLKEKPTYTYYSNAGIYFLKRCVLDMIPRGEHYNATDLMDQIINDGGKIMTYPLYCYWLDIGRPEDFQKAQEDVNHIKF